LVTEIVRCVWMCADICSVHLCADTPVWTRAAISPAYTSHAANPPCHQPASPSTRTSIEARFAKMKYASRLRPPSRSASPLKSDAGVCHCCCFVGSFKMWQLLTSPFNLWPLRDDYEKEGMRRSVDLVMLVQVHKHPHVLLLQPGPNFNKL